MKKKNSMQMMLASMSLMLMASPAFAQKFKVAKVERTRILVDKKWDAQPDAEAAKFIAPYQHKVDSIMGPVVGFVAHDMTRHRPESELSNLLSDILVWGGRQFNEQPVFSVYNMGGIRADFAKGDINVGDVSEVAPFENKICFLTLTGEKVLELFQQSPPWRRGCEPCRKNGYHPRRKAEERNPEWRTCRSSQELSHSHPRLSCRGQRPACCLQERYRYGGS